MSGLEQVGDVEMIDRSVPRVRFADVACWTLLPPLDDEPLPARAPASAYTPQAHDKLTASVQQRRAWLVDAAARCDAAVRYEYEARCIEQRLARQLARTIHEGSHPELALHIDALVGVAGRAASRVEDARALLSEMRAEWESRRASPPTVAPSVLTPQTVMPRVEVLPPRKRGPSREADERKRSKQRTGKECAQAALCVRGPCVAAPLGQAVR